MFTSRALPSILTVATFAVAHIAFGQAWQTVDQFQLNANLSAFATDIAPVASSAVLYSAGSAYVDFAGNYHAVVRKSTNSGATWSTVDTYSEPAWDSASFRAVSAAPNGSTFTGGELWTGPVNVGTKTWIVRESLDAGATWTIADAFQQGDTAKPSCGDVKMNPYTRDVFAVGVGNTGSNDGFYWLVRKRAVGSASFETSDLVGAPPINEARAVGFHPTAGVFVVGRMGDSKRDIWTVRRSRDGGTTWTTVDSFQDAAKTYSEARGITVSSSGAIYVCGKAVQSVKGQLVNNWVVRRSLDGGTTWTTVDRYGAQPAPYGSGDATATGIVVAPSGAVFVTGKTQEPSRIVVRKGVTASNGTMKWEITDNYQLVAGQPSEAQSIASDSFGNLFTTGSGQLDGTGLKVFLTRKLTGPQ